ncbi:MAG: polyprenyl synthetase family protein [Pseudomonadota bacterium]
MDFHLRSEIDLIPEIIQHLISSGGKRFRPLLLLICSDLCGYRGQKCYALSAVIEFIHTATLLHDDVIDKAETRRGKVSANNLWGNAASVLVGDFLYSKAFKLMADEDNPAVIRLISAATNVMSEGEVFQLVKCGDIDITEAEYLTIIEKKTSILMSAACASGAILGNATQKQIDALARFGLRLGSAFQITDDTLDYIAREEEFGKAIGKDLEEGKMTLPLIHTLKHCTSAEKDRIKKIIESKSANENAVREIMTIINRYDGISTALNKAGEYIDEGKASLGIFADSEAKTALFTVADFIMERRL